MCHIDGLSVQSISKPNLKSIDRKTDVTIFGESNKPVGLLIICPECVAFYGGIPISLRYVGKQTIAALI